MKGVLAVLAVLLAASAAVTRAAEPAAAGAAVVVPDTGPCVGLAPPSPECPPSWGTGGACLAPSLDGAGDRFWGGGEYLLWWVKDGPLPVPLVTTGDPLDPIPGALGQPGTRVLLGDHGLDFGTFSGLRVTVGGWLDDDRTWGAEGIGFLLEHRLTGFAAGSDPAGNPPLYVPVFRSELGREGSFVISDPQLILAGRLAIDATTRLWGAEFNVYRNLSRSRNLSLDALAGFRYLDLEESLNLNAPLNDPLFDIQETVAERFVTRNQFYGGQLGGRVSFRQGALAVDLVGKVALGSSHEVIDIAGATTLAGSGAATPGTFAGGILTQPSNIGRRAHDEFAVVPQVQVKLGYDIFPSLRATVGYDFLYWDDTVRPGNQIDRVVNQTQSLGGPLVGPARPLPLANHSDFWAQGVSFGLEFRY
jgi:hypothetical protein